MEKCESKPTPWTHTGRTSQEVTVAFGPAGRKTYQVTVPIGTLCHKLDGEPGGSHWVVAKNDFIENKSGLLFLDAQTYGIPIDEVHISKIEVVGPMVEKSIYEADLVELDYCVAQHQFPEWEDVQRRLETVDFLCMGEGHEPYTPTRGGQVANFLLENEIDQVTRSRVNLSTVEWEAVAIGNDQITAIGPTAFIAMVRCFLLNKNGTEKVMVPAGPLYE